MQDATRVSRYLAIIVRMTSYELLLEVGPILLSICRLTYLFRRGEISPSTMFRFETELQDLLRELGRRIMEWTLNRLEPEERLEMPSQFLWDGDYYRRRNKSPLRNLNCLFGPIKLLRFCYQPLQTCGKRQATQSPERAVGRHLPSAPQRGCLADDSRTDWFRG